MTKNLLNGWKTLYTEMTAGIKLTHEEASNRLDAAGFEFVGPYLGALAKTHIRCIEHDEVHFTTPNGIFRGHKLKCCRSAKNSLGLDFVDSVVAKKGYERVGEFHGCDNSFNVYCKRHNNVISVNAKTLLYKENGMASCCGNEAISIALTGRAVADDFGKRMSDLQAGENAYWYGKRFSKDHKNNISNGLAKLYKSDVQEHVRHAARGSTAGKPGYFYIFKVGDLYKFGSVSKMKPERRIAEIRRNTGLECRIELLAKVDDAGAYESEMMHRFGAYWVRGEYFDLSNKKVGHPSAA